MKKITKKLFILFSVVLISINSQSQDVVVLEHTNYTSHYSKSKHYPVMVEWWITKSKIGCPTPLKRKDNFQLDPLLPTETDITKDYIRSGTDRGHMMPAAENLCQTTLIQDECFYFSNITPQYASLNRGDWKSLEELERNLSKKYDSIHVWCGSIGELKKIGRVSIPKECWKVIYIRKTKEFMVFLFENNNSNPDGIKNNQVDIKDIETLTGFKFH